MYIPRSFHTTLALETLIDHFSGGKGISLTIDDLPDEFSKPAACFVSLNDMNGKMRGCMGAVSANKKNLYNEIINNTYYAAFKDNRFPPLEKHELENVSFAVEIVGPMIKVYTLEELNPDEYGIMVKDEHGNMGVMLAIPERSITAEQQLQLACKKGAITTQEIKELNIYKFRIKAHQ
jgi:AmmeMemoRadiSam system protein A